MRGRIFSFVQPYGKDKVHRGQIAIVKLRPQYAPRTYRIALAFYYQESDVPELVGVYVFPLEAQRPQSEEEPSIGNVIHRFRNEEIQQEDDPLAQEASE